MAEQTDWSKLQSLQKMYKPGIDLIVQGEYPKSLYILLSGRLSVYRHGVRISEIRRRGDYIGDIAMLLRTPASATARTETDIVVIEIEAGHVEKLIQHSPGVVISLARKMAERLADLNNSLSQLVDKSYKPEMVKRLQEHQKENISGRTSVVLNLDDLKDYKREFPDGKKLLIQGADPTALFILVSGTVEIFKNSKMIAVESEPGNYLGDVAVLRNKPSNGTVVTRGKVVVIEIPLEKVDAFLNHSPQIALSIAEKLAIRTLAINELFLDMKVDLMKDTKINPEDLIQNRLSEFDKIGKEIFEILNIDLH
ncbi:cyclic nucleotide-binding domain-containing protein [Leptospira ognonensis]|uniref:Cyclic nucleotide-binding domain-containing protein n=1 Tax=Leptospira ognonensis TaxID=2484945 RepID=A0A4R9KD41_9LEPT|nr:cyclic nucleotide-binding domain-containing protein [Leptospira ognonensis]TGL63062.1 cyclic nucleotide-binding domain-containing protein [Leptospira ognonensis]